jgi:hypothetical protein
MVVCLLRPRDDPGVPGGAGTASCPKMSGMRLVLEYPGSAATDSAGYKGFGNDTSICYPVYSLVSSGIVTGETKI